MYVYKYSQGSIYQRKKKAQAKAQTKTKKKLRQQSTAALPKYNVICLLFIRKFVPTIHTTHIAHLLIFPFLVSFNRRQFDLPDKHNSKEKKNERKIK